MVSNCSYSQMDTEISVDSFNKTELPYKIFLTFFLEIKIENFY